MIFLGTITLLLVIFAAIVVAKSISHPVVQLTETVQKFAQGNLRQQAPVIIQNEIGQLARLFNRMAGQLEASFDTIQRAGKRTSDR